MSITAKNYVKKIIKPLISALSTTALILPAAAQNVAIWAESPTRRIQFQLPGGENFLPESLDRSAPKMVALFKYLCLDLEGNPEKINNVINKPNIQTVALNLSEKNPPVPIDKDSKPLDIKIWQGPGMLVYQTNGNFPLKKPQCNIRFFTIAAPTKIELIAAIDNMMGAKPFNLSEEFDKKGRPEKYYSPQWDLRDKNNLDKVIFADSNFRDDNTVTLFSIVMPKKASK